MTNSDEDDSPGAESLLRVESCISEGQPVTSKDSRLFAALCERCPALVGPVCFCFCHWFDSAQAETP